MKKDKTYSQIEIEIADYIFANPKEKYKETLRKFAKQYEKPEATVKRYYYRAREYNHSRNSKIEAAKTGTLIAAATEKTKINILSRNESLEILSNIAKGETMKVENTFIIPTSGDRTRAIQQLSKMQGWETNLVDINFNSISDEQLNILINELTKDL